MNEPTVHLTVLTPSLDGAFGYAVVAHTANGVETELERFTGHVIEWHTLKQQGLARVRFYAKAFGLAYFRDNTDPDWTPNPVKVMP
jgi:hypothetical protein